MGTHVRLIAAPGAPVSAARRELDALAARLTRFDPTAMPWPRDAASGSPDWASSPATWPPRSG
jgi:hypothetical protein